jgi:hypothetical protein
MRRRLGFARRLAALAELGDGEQAAITAGLFLHSLVVDLREEERTRPAQAWNEYLLRNVDWLAPALEVCHAARAEWDEESDRASTLAKVSVVFDRETLEEHKRTLESLIDLRDDPPTELVAEIAEILWSEEGQALCDRHFRGHKRNYKLEPAEIRRSLAALKPAVPRALAEAAATPVRLSSSIASAAARRESKREEQVVDTKAMSEVFEKRRQALRTTQARDEEPPARAGAGAEQIEEKVAEIARRAQAIDYEDAPPEREYQPITAPEPAQSEPEPVAVAAPQAEPAPPRRRAEARANNWEENMDNIRSITAARDGRREDNEITERLGELRSQLRQIQRIALEGEELLTALAPQIDEFTAMFGHLESMVQRWKSATDGAPPPQRADRAA